MIHRPPIRGLRLALVLAGVELVFLSAVPAQMPTGAIRGTVSDPQGAVIPHAVVTVVRKTTGESRRVTTTADGNYAVENLMPGVYEVTVEFQGFAPQVRQVTVQVGTITSSDFSLQVNSQSETIEVLADPPLIDAVNYKIAGVITRERIDALPLNGRNFLQLAALEPGVSVSVSNPGQNNNLFNVSIGGAPASLTRITVDGGSVVDYVTGGAAQNFSTETIQEFQIATFNFDLSTGVTSVGAVNIVSRMGGNELHGTVFAFYRDHNIAAYPTLKRNERVPDPFFRRAQYGGSLGGPLKKDRAFFFGNVEWLNQRAAISTVHTGFPGFSQFDAITTSPYDGVLANARTDFRLKERHTLFVRYSHDRNDTFAPDDVNTLPSNWRINRNRDHNAQIGIVSLLRTNLINDFRFNYQRINNRSTLPTARECPPDTLPCMGLGGPQIRVVGSNLILGNSYNAPQHRQMDRYQSTNNIFWQKGAHNLRFGGEWDFGYGKGSWAFFDPALIAVHDPRIVQLVNSGVAVAPLPSRVKQALTLVLPPAFTVPGATITLADLLQLPLAVAFVGVGDPSQPPPFNARQARRNHRVRFYGQDSWRVRRGFTLSFGFSYQLENNLLNHDLPKPALLGPLLGRLDPPGKDVNNLAPALGFAWDVGARGKTIIRGGAGLYYDTVLIGTRLTERAFIGPLGNGRTLLTGAFFQNPIPFPQIAGLPSPLDQINPQIGAPLNFTSIPTKFTGRHFLDVLASQLPQIRAQLETLGRAGLTNIDFFKTGTDLLDPSMQVPYSEQFSLGVQRQLPHQMALSADVVLRKRVHTLFQTDRNLYNRVDRLGGPIIRRCQGAEATDPSVRCSNGPISIYQTSGREEYRALLVKLDKRFSHRYQFTASYALSSLTGFFPREDLTGWFRHRGPLEADARHRFSFSGIIDLPRGFQMSLIAVYAGRPPLNARLPATYDLNGDGTFGDTLPGLPINSLGRSTSQSDLIALVRRFNETLAGTKDAAGATLPFLVLPPRFDFNDTFQTHDVRLSKTFALRERYKFQVLVEVFNLFNISNLGGYSSQLDFTSDPQTPPGVFAFGQPTLKASQVFGQGGARAVQFGARISF